MKNQCIYHCIKGNKILRSQLNQRLTRLVHWKLQNLTQGNERGPRTNGKMGQAHELGGLTISKVMTLPKAIYRFKAITTNIPNIQKSKSPSSVPGWHSYLLFLMPGMLWTRISAGLPILPSSSEVVTPSVTCHLSSAHCDPPSPPLHFWSPYMALFLIHGS